MNHFSQKLSELLKENRSISSTMLSEIAGISRAQVSRILSGSRAMTPEAVGAISVLFDEKGARELLAAHLLNLTPTVFEFEREVFKGIIKDGNYLRPGRKTKHARFTPKAVVSTKACLFHIEQAALENDDIRQMVHSLAHLCQKM